MEDTVTGEEKLLAEPGAGEAFSAPEPRADGREVFFLQTENQADIWVASVAEGGAL